MKRFLMMWCLVLAAQYLWAGEVEANNLYYTWVDKVNVRSKPQLDASAVDQLSIGEDVIYLGQKTKEQTKVSLQGKDYTDSWAKVQTRNGKTGWIHAATLLKKKAMYCWLDKVNVRETPDLKGKVSGQMKENEKVTYLGYQTDTLTEVSLRGKTYKEPWLKIETESGVTGWVHAATVKNLVMSPAEMAKNDSSAIRVGKNRTYKDLQSAVNDAPDGGTIILDAGKYSTEGTIELKGKFNLTIKGEGKVEVITTSQWNDVITISESENIQLENLTLRHDIPVNDYCSGMVINMYNVKDIKVINCDVNGCGWLGLYAYKLDTLLVKDCYFHDNFEFALSFDGEGKNVRIENCRIDQNGGGVSPDWSQDIQSDNSPVDWITLVNNFWGVNHRPGEDESNYEGDEGGDYYESDGYYYD